MSCNSAIFTVNQTNETIVTEAGTFVQIPFGSVIRRFGRNLRLEGGGIMCCDAGYFDIDATITVTPTAAGPITAKIRQNGVDIPGVMDTVTGVADLPTSISLTGLMRNCGCNCDSVLTLWIDAPCSINNAAVVIKKV